MIYKSFLFFIFLFISWQVNANFYYEISDREKVQNIIDELNLYQDMQILVLDLNNKGQKTFLNDIYNKNHIKNVQWIATIFYSKNEKNIKDTCIIFIREKQNFIINHAQRLNLTIDEAWKIISMHEIMHCIDNKHKITNKADRAEVFADSLVWLYLQNYHPDKILLFKEINLENSYPHNTFEKIKDLNIKTQNIDEMINFIINKFKK